MRPGPDKSIGRVSFLARSDYHFAPFLYDMGVVIGIDASRAFGEERTGTENYSYSLINSLIQLPETREHRWILYTKPGQFEIKSLKFEIGRLENVKLVEVGLPRLWTQVGLAARTWIDGLDVLWVPAHTLPVLRKPGLPTVVTIHGLEYEFLPHYYGEWARWHLTWSTEYAVASASRIIAVSQFTRDALITRLGADPGKIDVVHEGVLGIDKFEIRNSKFEKNRNKTRKNEEKLVLRKHGVEKGKYLLFVGTVQPRKNLVRLIEAFCELNSKFEIRNSKLKSLKLIIAGKFGWDYEEILETPKKFGVEDDIVFTGYINDAERYILLANALVYVQPSLTEGFGLPVLEAMQMGVPVASSTGGALPEVVGDAAETFDPLDVSQMSEKLSKLIRDKTLMERLVEKGKKRAQEFAWEKAARETLSVLEKTAQGK